MVKVLQNYPQTVTISATNKTTAKAWARKKGYVVDSIESVGLSAAKRKRFFGTTSLIYWILKR